MSTSILALCTLAIWLGTAAGADMAEELTNHGIVPDVIDTPWTEKLEVSYPKSNVKADYGNELTPTQVRNQPDVSWEADEGSFYTVCMTDPDAPSRKDPTAREWLHWLVVNVPGSSIKKGTPLAEYIGSAPPKGTGLHRYVQLVYKQPKNMTFCEEPLASNVAKGRPKFSISKFAKKYGLGSPIAGNFYQAQWDKTSDAIAQTFG